MFSANLSFSLLEKYLKMLTSRGFLRFEDLKYEVTSKGQDFLSLHESYLEKKQKIHENLKDLENEKIILKNLLLEKFVAVQFEKSYKTIEPAFREPSSSFSRINGSQFRQELCTLGFKPEEAKSIVYWVNIIYANRPGFLSGKKTNSIKTCLAYLGCKVFNYSRIITQRDIALFYGLSWPNQIQNCYASFLVILKKVEPSVFGSI
jgi:hypothetical protein